MTPLVGGAAVKGPTAKIMGELGVPATSREIARHYAGLIDGFVLDRRDAHMRADFDCPLHVTDTLMVTWPTVNAWRARHWPSRQPWQTGAGEHLGLVPVKARSAGKQRLAAALPEPARARLVRVMLRHVLGALAGCAGIDSILVMSPQRDELAARDRVAARPGGAA